MGKGTKTKGNEKPKPGKRAKGEPRGGSETLPSRREQDVPVTAEPARTRRVTGLYLDLLAKVLTRTLHHDDGRLVPGEGRVVPVEPGVREHGGDWPAAAETMVGVKRLENTRDLVERVLREQVPGDLIETGVWRGGAAIYMRAVLAAYEVTDRSVWLADSFRGLPPGDGERFPADTGVRLDIFPELAVSIDEVQANFARYGLLDGQVRFLPGWFRDTLPNAPIERLALIRLDGDLYESTMIALEALYPKLSPGGFVIVDDYGAVEPCRQATHDFRERMGITAPLVEVDWTGRWWRRE